MASKEFKHNFNVGDGVSATFNGDYYPGTVTRVTPCSVEMREDSWVCTKPMTRYGSDDAEYEYTPNPNGRVWKFRLKKSGYLREVGGGYGIISGKRYRMNPHF